MADNVVVTPGTGNTVAADEVVDATLGTVKVQYVKLMDGTLDGTGKAAVSASGLKVDLGADNDVVVTATDLDVRPLVNTDVVTAELSAVDNAVLDTIAAKDFATQTTLAAMNAKMVTGTDIGDVTINNASGAAAVNIQDGGNTITVDGTVTANLGAVDNAVLDQLELNQDSQTAILTTIDGDTGAIATDVAAIETLLTTIEGNQLPDGHNVTIDNPGDIGGGTQYTEDAAAAANPVGNALMLVREDARAGSLTTTDGDNVALRGNNKGEAYVKDTDAAALLTTIDTDTGAMVTDLAAIETLLTTIEGNQLPDSHNVTVDNTVTVDLGANNDVTVTGTVTANLSATDNQVLDDISADTGNIDTKLGTIDTDTGNIAAGFAAEGAALGSGVLLQGDDGTDRTNVLVDAAGHLQVDVLTMPAGGSGLTDTELRASPVVVDLGANNDITGTVTANLSAVDNAVLDQLELNQDAQTALLTTMDADTGAIKTALETAGGLVVNLGANNDVTVTGSVTADLGANNDVTVTSGTITAELSAVDNAVLDTIDAVLDTIKTDTASVVTATQLIDDTVFADDAAVTLGTSKGNISAGVAVATDGTDPTAVSAEGDAAALRTDMNRLLIVNQTHPRFWHVSADYASAQTNASVKAAPGASLSLYITDISISNGATAGNITLLDGSGGTVLLEIYPAINGGAVLSLRSPIKLTANTALCITSTTVTTHSVFVSGYIAA